MREYNYRIDQAIVNELFYNNKDKVRYRELKKAIEIRLNLNKRKLSFEVFNYRIQQMMKTMNSSRYAVSPVLKREYHGRGKKGSYSLTKDAKRRCRLELPILKVDSEREKAYQLLFMYLYGYDVSRLPLEDTAKYTFTTEEQFNSFLSKIHLCREDFKFIYESKGQDGYHFSKMFDPYQKVLISKTEKYCSYMYVLPGVSPKDFIKGTKTGMVFEHIQFTKPEIQKAFNLLEKEGLIRKIKSAALELLGEDTRYDITADNEDLREFIKDCWVTLFGATYPRMMFTWKNFRRPNKEEKKWHEMLWGPIRTKIFFANYDKSLKSLKREGKLQRNKAKKPVQVNG